MNAILRGAVSLVRCASSSDTRACKPKTGLSLKTAASVMSHTTRRHPLPMPDSMMSSGRVSHVLMLFQILSRHAAIGAQNQGERARVTLGRVRRSLVTRSRVVVHEPGDEIIQVEVVRYSVSRTFARVHRLKPFCIDHLLGCPERTRDRWCLRNSAGNVFTFQFFGL